MLCKWLQALNECIAQHKQAHQATDQTHCSQARIHTRVVQDGQVGIRLSPHEGVGPNDVRDTNPEVPFSHVMQQLGQHYSRRLAYVHLIETTRS